MKTRSYKRNNRPRVSEPTPCVSFCTTCMNRLMHLERTLPHNLRILSETAVCEIEFVLLDYGSSDGLEQWLRDGLGHALASRRFVAYRTDEPVRYDSSQAKNLAHRLSGGSVICNLDADQFLTPRFLRELHSRFEGSRDCVLHGRGCAWGRVALRRERFFALGGYDETFVGWGVDDLDLIRRAKARFGLEEVAVSRRSTPYIDHGDDLRTANFDLADVHKSRSSNRARMRQNLRAGRLIANVGKDWGAGVVRRIYPASSSFASSAPSAAVQV